ncbi:hypothetical protein R1sor_013754 [Riccia sorocarpa]|uniref:Uncharacterized protein n=1 Tax=Riccia sorocarpa TaxID=122646 RepID=A0ABD3HAP1_9MARC
MIRLCIYVKGGAIPESDRIKDDSLENRRSPPKPVTPAQTPELIVLTAPLGSQGLELSEQGSVCMGMSAFYGPPKPDEEMIVPSMVLPSPTKR